MKALRIKSEGKTAELVSMSKDDLTPGDVLIKTEYSSLNYKDALAVTNKGKILRKFPLNAGIDVAGTVEESADPNIKKGAMVLTTGCGLSETIDGGLAEYCRVPSKWVIKIPKPFTSKHAMAIGTAGFTAGLCLAKMEQNDQNPKNGPIVITGASGGVGSIATALFANKGYEVWAVSSKKDSSSRLKELGAAKIVTPEDLNLGDAPLLSTTFGGAIDNVGGKLLSQIIAATNMSGNVASVGLAADFKLSTTVMPFILRGVNLLGISSSNCPKVLREKIWQNLFATFSPTDLEDFITETITLDKVFEQCQNMISRKTQGRYLVKI